MVSPFKVHSPLGQLRTAPEMFLLFVVELGGFIWNDFKRVSYAIVGIVRSIEVAPFGVYFEPDKKRNIRERERTVLKNNEGLTIGEPTARPFFSAKIYL